ncbi:MAG: alanine racemase [Chloroflexota bacterium]|jgi:alanine racemase
MTDRRGAWLEIDLEAIRHNIGLVREVVGPAAVAPVVKAEAYGHGMVPVSRAIAPVVEALCVATLDEAIALRPHVDRRIIMLYPVPHPAVPEAVTLDVELPVMSAADLDAIRAAARADRPPVHVHIGVETGMGRGGLQPERVAAVAAAAQADPNIELAGLWSHLHSPEDPPTSDAQLLRFELAVAALRDAHIPVPPRHSAASGGIFTHDEPALDFVRPGVAIYGVLDESLPIAPDALEAASRLRPAMSLKARPIAFSDVPEGGTVGYGGTWRAQRPTRIAVLPVGYGDGYLRGVQPGAEVLVRGRRTSMVGRVSMDAVTIDVTDLPGLGYDEEFVLLGAQGTERITAGELARRRNTIVWEVLTSMAPRLARVYHPLAGTSDSQ